MKFDQPKKYDQINIFLKKPCTKCDGEISPRPFYKKSKLSISLDQQFKVLYSLFLYLSKSTITKTYWTLGANHFLLFHKEFIS